MFSVAPPVALEIEKDVLSTIVNYPELLVNVEQILNSDCFYEAENRVLYDIIMEIHLEGQKVDASHVLQKLFGAGKKDLLSHYQSLKKNIGSSNTLWKNATTLLEYSTKRSILENSLQALSLIEQDANIEDIDRVVSKGVEIVTGRSNNIDSVTFKESIEKMKALMNKPLTDGISGLTTGLPSLNKFNSGWQSTDRILVAGRPGMAKSILAAFHAYEVAVKGDPVAVISLEMEDSQLTGRMISNISNVNSSDILKGRLVENQKRHVDKVASSVANLPIYYYGNTQSADINDIFLAMRNWKRRFGIKMIILDFVQLCKDRTVKNQEATPVLDSVIGKLTDMSNQLGVALMILSQLNRGSESLADKRPSLSNLKNSGRLEEFGTTIIFPYRQDYYDERAATEKGLTFVPSNRIEYIIAKNRSDATGTLLFMCNPALNRIYEFPKNDLYPPQAPPVDPFAGNQVLNEIKPISFL